MVNLQFSITVCDCHSVTCSAAASRPPALLSWRAGGVRVEGAAVTPTPSPDRLVVTSSLLQLLLLPSHVPGIRLDCTASLGPAVSTARAAVSVRGPGRSRAATPRHAAAVAHLTFLYFIYFI